MVQCVMITTSFVGWGKKNDMALQKYSICGMTHKWMIYRVGIDLCDQITLMSIRFLSFIPIPSQRFKNPLIQNKELSVRCWIKIRNLNLYNLSSSNYFQINSLKDVKLTWVIVDSRRNCEHERGETTYSSITPI